MKSRITHTLAALLFAGAAPLAFAQAAKPAYLDEPVATVSKSSDLANAIAQALNGDASLKQSKITVQPEGEASILLTGVTTNNAQRNRAAEIATSQAGAGKVVNALTSGELVIAPAAPAAPAAVLTDATTSADTVAVASDFVAAPEPKSAASQ